MVTSGLEPAADFGGRWRIVDTVTAGEGAGQTFTFDVVLAQSGATLSGGNAQISLSGTVSGDTATVQFTQPSLGYSGTFVWTLTGRDAASGSFSSSVPNSGTSQLVRLG